MSDHFGILAYIKKLMKKISLLNNVFPMYITLKGVSVFTRGRGITTTWGLGGTHSNNYSNCWTMMMMNNAVELHPGSI